MSARAVAAGVARHDQGISVALDRGSARSDIFRAQVAGFHHQLGGQITARTPDVAVQLIDIDDQAAE